MTLTELFSITIHAPDEEIRAAAKRRWDALAKPLDGLGHFEDILGSIAAVRGTVLPDISKKVLIIMCADNGVTEEGVSQADQKVTYDVAALMGRKRSSVGVMAKHYPLDILTVDIGINSGDVPEGVLDRKVRRGTADFIKEPAMTEEECLKAVGTGIELAWSCADKGYGLIATGEMGIGNTTSSAALISVLSGRKPEELAGRGAGLTDEGIQRKLSVIREALEFHFPGRSGGIFSGREAFEALRKVGGLDIAGLAGVFIGGAMRGVPVVIDGVISAAAALAAGKMVPGCRFAMIASHSGRERGTTEALHQLGLVPVIDADLALGEGSGAVLLLPMLDMAMSLYQEGTFFSETGIGQYKRPGL